MRLLPRGCAVTDAPNSGLQKLRERGYDTVPNEIAEGLKRWDNFRARQLSLTNAYRDGKCQIHAHLIIRVLGKSGPLHHYCVEYIKPIVKGNVLLGGEIRHCCDVDSLERPSEILAGESGTNDESAVLVDPTQLVDLPEWMLVKCVPSVIRLQQFDSRLGHWCDETNPTRRVLLVCDGIVKDREFRTLDTPAGQIGRELIGESECQMVEGGSKIENTISDQDAQSRSGSGDFMNPDLSGDISIRQRLQRWFRVWLVESRAGFALDPRSGLRLNGIEVFARPL